MNKDNSKFNKAILMLGDDVVISNAVTLHHPTVREVLSIGKVQESEELYWTYVQILLSDPYSNMVMLDDMGKNYLEISPYELFCLYWDKCQKEYIENKTIYDAFKYDPIEPMSDALSFFVEGEHLFRKGRYNDGTTVFFDVNNPSCQIDKEIFELIYEWVKAINKIDYSDRIKPADENARRILIEDMREEIKKAKRRKRKSNDSLEYLGNLMSANCFCGNSAITPFNVGDCKIYWLNEALTINNKKDNADRILDGIYHGAISYKDINKKELDWMK